MLDVLMYLFEHYMEESAMIATDLDKKVLHSQLSEAGFNRVEIRQAFGWLDGLTQHQQLAQNKNSAPTNAAKKHSIRLYSREECQQLNLECRGYLHFLEYNGILTPDTRELVIDRSLALKDELIDLDQLKWVILMVLFNQPLQNDINGWMEDLVFSEPAAGIH